MLTSNAIEIYNMSLIKFSPLPYNDLKADWIFFYSKTAVKYFLEQNGEIKARKVATFGAATAKYLSDKYAITVNFIGTGERQNVAKKFKAIIGDSTCLYIVGKNSIRSIQILLKNKCNKEIIVYNNVPKTDFNVPIPDIAVFTSPMAVSTYYKKFSSREHFNIAIGPTTLQGLKKIGKTNNKMASEPTEKAMAKEVQTYLNNF